MFNIHNADDLAQMEETVRLDVLVYEGEEYYASFNADGEQLTEWESYENAMESYQALFIEDAVEEVEVEEIYNLPTERITAPRYAFIVPAFITRLVGFIL